MMGKLLIILFTVVSLVWVTPSTIHAQDATQNTSQINISSGALGISIHGEQTEKSRKLKVLLEPDKIKAQAMEPLSSVTPFAGPINVVHGTDTNFIVFGYQQSDAGYDYHYIWPSLTHIGASFTYFDGFGNITAPSTWTGRSSRLKAGGSAQANGVKVIMVLTNQYNLSSAYYWEYTVMTSATNRQRLVNNVVSLVTSDGYCQGVSFDFEPWISDVNVRNGITAFTQSLATTLKAISSTYEISYYINSIYSSSQIDIANIMPYLDYVLYSCYDWSGSSPHAISDVNSFIPDVNGYLNAGLPANKMVLALSTYGDTWIGDTTYNQSGGSKNNAIGFEDGIYNTNVIPRYGGPFTDNYVTGDEAAWYTYTSSTTHTDVWADAQALEYQSRLVKSWQDSGDVNNGKKLRGIGFWSLYWTATPSSYDPITHTAVSKTRLYPQPFQIFNEVFNPPGNRNYLIEKFEGPDSQRDYRWRECSESPDSKGYSATLTLYTTSPSGTGQPPYSDNAIRLTFTFASTSGNQLFFRHEILDDDTDTGTVDREHAKFYVTRNSKIQTYLYSAGTYSGRDVRMVIMDTTRHVFKSSPYSLGTLGWQTIVWDLTDSSQISGYTTAEPAFISGGSTFASSTSGDKDIGFIGFLLEGGTNGTGTVYFDEISYTPTNPNNQNYVINEFRYNNTSQEFVEIYGPAGTLPSGMQLRFYNSTNGSVSTAINLSGTIVDSGNGYGYFVVGASGVTNVNQVLGGSTTFPNTQPGGMQLYNTNNGNVYDSVVYQAFGGLGDLIRKQTLGVTQNGYGWLGEVASGTNSAGQTYSMGRYPDGANTWINENDFSFMPSTPGISNGGSVIIGQTFDFTTAPTNAFMTYDTMTVFNPTSAGLPASPGSGGNALRCADYISGGGNMCVIGDASLSANSTGGYKASGYMFIPSGSADTNAIAIGICGRQGSNFFTSTKATLDKTGYESGYWLVYENRAGMGLNDGLSDHAGTFNFEYAHNDNMDTAKVVLLSSVSLGSTGAIAGSWTPFTLAINPAQNLLQVFINNVVVYNGWIPTNGPISGAFQVGFRQKHAGLPNAAEGTWIDDLSLSGVTAIPANLSVSQTVLSFTTYQGGANPSTQSLAIINNSPPSFSWSAISSQSWLFANPTSGSVNGFSAQTIQVGAITGTLTVGTYTAQLIITAPGAGNSPQIVNVTFVVNPIPILSIIPTFMSFTANQAGQSPPSQSLVINNTGTASMSWSASSSQTWLFANPASGIVNSFSSQTIQVGATVGTLVTGPYSAQLTVTAPGAINNPQNLSVNFIVNPPITTSVHKYYWLFYE